MRKILYTLVLTMLFSCGSKENAKLSNAVDSLTAIIDTRNKEINNMESIVSIISEGLDSIKVQENIIFFDEFGIERRNFPQRELKNELDNLAMLIERQRCRIKELEDSLSLMKEGNALHFQKIIAFLNQQLSEKEQKIVLLEVQLKEKERNIRILNKKVNSLNKANDSLSTQTINQENALAINDSIINKCYIKYGTKKELRDLGLISSKLLSKSSLDFSKFDKKLFTVADIRDVSELDLPAKKAEILTYTPTSSYEFITNFNGNVTLKIINPTEFWSLSNFLIIQLK